MEVVVLGTSSATPTKERNHSAVLLKYEGKSLLFDCGEGTQRQLILAGESPMKIDNIFVTHWHGDHVLGIPGLLQTLGLHGRTKPIHIWGPIGSKKRMDYLMQGFQIRVKCDVVVHEVNPKTTGKIYGTEKFEIWATKLVHSTTCFGYSFKEKDKLRLHKNKVLKLGLQGHPILKKLQQGKDITHKGKKIKAKDMTYLQLGKKFTLVLDSEYTEKIATLAKGSDLFVCESTFSSKEKELAKKRNHMTSKQAARLAKKAGVKKLVLTHFSQRYKSLKDIEKEAKSVFKNTTISKDLMIFKV